MAKDTAYIRSKAYHVGYADGVKDATEKALAYWHKILDSQGINQVVFVEFIEAMED